MCFNLLHIQDGVTALFMTVHEKNTDVFHALILAGANVDLAENVRTVFNMTLI